MQLSMYRPKTRKFTSALIFPDRDSICNDSYFATAYYLVISKHSSDYLLPSFGSKLQKKDGKVNSSKVSTLFKALVTKLYELVDRYIESVDVTHPINEEYAFADLSQTNLTSHCARKSTFNKLAESSVQAHNWMFRVALELKHVNTIFDYLTGASLKVKVDGANGKVLSGWCRKGNAMQEWLRLLDEHGERVQAAMLQKYPALNETPSWAQLVKTIKGKSGELGKRKRVETEEPDDE